MNSSRAIYESMKIDYIYIHIILHYKEDWIEFIVPLLSRCLDQWPIIYSVAAYNLRALRLEKCTMKKLLKVALWNL